MKNPNRRGTWAVIAAVAALSVVVAVVMQRRNDSESEQAMLASNQTSVVLDDSSSSPSLVSGKSESELSKKQLEDLLHPLVYQEIFSRIAEFGRAKQLVDIVIIAIPLLFETHSEKRFDRVLVIDVPEKLQLKRSMQRDQCSRELIEQIMDAQVSRQTRLSKADDVIYNAGTLSELQKQVNKMYQFYCSLAKNDQQT